MYRSRIKKIIVIFFLYLEHLEQEGRNILRLGYISIPTYAKAEAEDICLL